MNIGEQINRNLKREVMQKKILIVEDEFIVANDLANILGKANYQVIGVADSYDEALSFVQKQKPDMVLLDIRLKGILTGIDLAEKLMMMDVPFIYLSANSNKSTLEKAKLTKPYGFLVKPFREKDLLVALEIASYHHTHREKFKEVYNSGDIGSLKKVTFNFKKFNDAFLKIAISLQESMAFDYVQIEEIVNGEIINFSGAIRTGHQEYQLIGIEQLSNICGSSKNEIVSWQKNPEYKMVSKIYTGETFKSLSETNEVIRKLSKTLSLIDAQVFPIKLSLNTIVNFTFFSKRNGYFTEANKSDTFEGLLLEMLTPFLTPESKQIKETPNPSYFENIIGNHPSILKIFDQIRRVAPMETSVLITGESGTGKELIAKNIHLCSLRKNKPFVVLNCGTLPENLIESILFGHEKGSFTGAVEKRIGKFEQANGGTIFLDEIGEMPIDMQVKLLRVLQEKEIERIGGTQSIKLDIRIVAATNKNLEEEVEAGRFRLDLYYRLQVFPINLPALRDRRGDIPLLINHFLQKKGESLGLRKTIHPQIMTQLSSYDWPGNIRELEHYIEKSILLSPGEQISDIYLKDFKSSENNQTRKPHHVQTIDEIEKDHIFNILIKCKGKIFGPGGAAEILKIPVSTLNSKIKKLGIKKEDIYIAKNP